MKARDPSANDVESDAEEGGNLLWVITLVGLRELGGFRVREPGATPALSPRSGGTGSTTFSRFAALTPVIAFRATSAVFRGSPRIDGFLLV